MKKSLAILIFVVVSFGCNSANSDSSPPISLIIDRSTFYVNESVQFQIRLGKEGALIRSCSEIGTPAILERHFNDEWVSLGSMSDSVYDFLVTEGIIDSVFLLDSGYFRLRLPYRYLNDTNNLYSECFTVMDTVRHKIGITTEKLCYSENDEIIRISILNKTDSAIYFTSWAGQTDFLVWELQECGSWSGYWGNAGNCICPIEWHSVPSDSLYQDWSNVISNFPKGVYRIEYDFYDSLHYYGKRSSVYSNVFTVE